jgi:hypothetical protein
MIRLPQASAFFLCLVVSGCTLPGVETSRIESQGLVDVGGQLCDYVMRVSETPTVNGLSRFYNSTITCDGQTFDCGDADGDVCIAQVEAAIASQ